MLTSHILIVNCVAVQCNLSGQPYWMITQDAPDPRDLFWSNIGASRKLMESRKILVQSALLLGVLGWGVIVTYIHNLIRWITGDINDDEYKFIGVISGQLNQFNFGFVRTIHRLLIF